MRSTVAGYGPAVPTRGSGSKARGRAARDDSGGPGPSGAEAVPGLLHGPAGAHRTDESNDPLGESRSGRETADSLARLLGRGSHPPTDICRSMDETAGADAVLPVLRRRTAGDRSGEFDRPRGDRTLSPAMLRALAPVPAPGAAVIHRQYKPTQAEEQDFGEIATKWPDADPVGARALAVKWCSKHAQFLSLVNNFSWPEFRALAKKYPTGDAVPVKAAAIRTKMQKEMQAELQQIAAAKAAAWTAQVDHYRLTGAPGPSMNYDLFLQKNILKVAHHSTFRTLDEKSQKGPNGSGPYTRNFSAEVGGVGAQWEIHVHYADNGSPQKAHAKLVKDRHSKVHVADLKLASLVIGETTNKIDAATDAKERARADW